MATTPLGFAAKMKTLSSGSDKAGYVGCRNAALRVTVAARAALPSSLRGVGTRGARVGARFDGPKKLGDNYTALVRATGPAQLIERDTRPHYILPRRRGKKALSIPGIGARAYAEHPGTSGKHLFEKAVMAMSGQVGEQFYQPYRALMRAVI